MGKKLATATFLQDNGSVETTTGLLTCALACNCSLINMTNFLIYAILQAVVILEVHTD